MAVRSLGLAGLRGLSQSEKQKRLAAFVAGRNGPPNGELGDLDAQISEFETRYEMSSDTMRALYREQKLKETADICTWLMLLDLRDRIASAS